MSEENWSKRFEPINFMLISGMLAILFGIGFSFYKYYRNIKNGTIIPASITWYHWSVLLVGVVGVMVLLLSSRFSNQQHFHRFRTAFGLSFFIFLMFLWLLLMNFPLWRIQYDVSAQELGHYYFNYISGYYSLFLLLGLVGQGIILSKIFRNLSYIDSFIYSVNPPNVLNMSLLIKYMVFVVALWAFILIVLKIYAS